MPPAALDTAAKSGLVMLFVGMAALFAGSRLLAVVLPRHESWVGARAVAYFIPIAVLALVATLLGRTEVATGVLFGTSVGAMTAALGYVVLGSPVENGPQRWRRIWPFQLAAGLIVFVAGFRGILDWHAAVALVIEGAVILGLWRDRPTGEPADDPPGQNGPFSPGPAMTYEAVLNYAAPPPDAEASRLTPQQALVLAAQILAACAVLGVAAWAVTRGAQRTSGLVRILSTSSLAGTAISLALVTPMMVGSWRLAAGGRAWSPVTTLVGVVLLNLCCLLPVLILIPYAAAHVPALSHWAGDALAIGEGIPRPLVFPTPMWRIDTVVLIIAGVLLLPVAFGKWSLGREEGMALLAGYFFFLTATLASG